VGHLFPDKVRILIIILTTLTGIAFGQSPKTTLQCEKVLDTLTNREIYNAVDTQASIIGGVHKLYSELGTIKFPKDPDIDQIKIFISFIVEANGDITGLKAIGKMESTKLDTELLQLFRKYKWEPGTCKGEKVSTRLVFVVKS
jgi:hypothetical protein